MDERARAAAESQPMQTPLIELIVRRCWVPDCRYLAAFRDGAGWWWCYEHRDRAGHWGVEEIASYDDALARSADAVAQAVQEREEWIVDLRRSLRTQSELAVGQADEIARLRRTLDASLEMGLQAQVARLRTELGFREELTRLREGRTPR